MVNMNAKEGKLLIKIARRVVEEWTKNRKQYKPATYPNIFNKKGGVFVTIHTKSGELRGCIGYPEPHQPLIDALINAAIGACNDPRFEPLKPDELNNITIEVSVLSKPEEIEAGNPKEYPKHIEIGKDGLIVKRGLHAGLLLPQVATEWGWDAEEFLSNTCIKAGLSPDAWLDEHTKIYKFHAEIFKED